jgi:hypothetical protein
MMGRWSLSQVAEATGFKQGTVERWIAHHGLEAHNDAGIYVVYPNELARFLTSIGVGVPDKVRAAAGAPVGPPVEAEGYLVSAGMARPEDVATVILARCEGYDVRGESNPAKRIEALIGRRVKVTIEPAEDDGQ